MSGSPLRCGTVTGMVSSSNRPASIAATARACERTAHSSCSSRVMPYSRPTFSAVSIMPPATGKRRAARVVARLREPVEQGGRPAGVPAHVGHVVLGLAHALRTAGQHEVGPAGRDLHARVQHRLETRAAASIDLQARDRDVEARVEGRDAADRGGLAVGVPLPEDHVVDVAGRDAGALDQPLDDRGRQRR